ncbi:MAG: DNA mismatch repair protein MutS [Promethearchaeota archaeon]
MSMDEHSLAGIDSKKLTPMMQHWYHVRKKYPKEYLIAYRMGDFFEFFYEDAERVSKLLGITLTKRKVGNESYPLAGIPHHSGNYLINLVNMGQTVVVVDQLEDPATVKGRIIKRGVVKILSPGTIMDSEMIRSNENNYIAAIVKEKRGYGVAFADLTTGEFLSAEYSAKLRDPMEKLLSVFSQHDPVELIIPSKLKNDENLLIFLKDLMDALIKPHPDHCFTLEEARTTIMRQFNLSNLEGFGLEGHPLAIQAAGGLLAFLKETQRDTLPNIFKITLIQEEGILHLDYITQQNLELTKSLWERGKDVTLYSIFNCTHTPMGARLLKKIILKPLTDIEEINYRLNIVEKFKQDIFLRSDLREKLKELGDLERFINRINYSGTCNARDLNNLKNALGKIPEIKKCLKKAAIPEISKFLSRISEFEEVRRLIEEAIEENPPPTVKEGNIIRSGYDERIDELRDILHNGKKYILEYERAQKKRWNLTSGLKVGHNNILGYYIEITKRTLQFIPNIPPDYVERQTLKNAKRFTTAELKKLEEKIIEAEEKIYDLEYELFCKVREKAMENTPVILETARSMAMIDVLSSFAEIAENYNYCRPVINDDDKIIIKEGRHPVIEQINYMEPFIPNDCYLDTEKEQVLIITGPNMAGKSTYLRQVALICLMAQMGSFVPASSATIGIIDQIFTRIGASDDLARKLSTFMIEMTETAKILNYATTKSLVIIDELGRGTSTSDGQSIAMATLEKLHEMQVKTLFSTHYHQLTEINLPRVKNYHLDIIENEDGSINFVRKLKPGSTDKSYGIHVARVAGLPDDVIIRAFAILEEIENHDPFIKTVRNHDNEKHEEQALDKVISSKKKTLEALNEKLNAIKKQISKHEEELERKNALIKEKENKIRELELKSEELVQKLSKKPSSKKKFVQTSFFKPIIKSEVKLDANIKQVVEILKNLDIENLTPVEAMKAVIKLKEKLEEK